MKKKSPRTITVYTPESSLNLGWIQALRQTKRTLVDYRHFIWQMAKTSFLSSFRNSALGILWAFILPLVGPVVYVMLQVLGVFSGQGEYPRALYVVAGFFFWNLWAETTISTMNCITRNAGFVQKNDVPLIPVFIGNLGTILFSVLPTSILFLTLAVYYGVGSHIYLLLLPVTTLLIIMLGLGMGMLLALFAVFSDDFKNIVAIGMRYCMFASAVIFPMPSSHWVGAIIQYNPLLHLVDGGRNLVLFGFAGQIHYLPYLGGIALVLLLFGSKKIINLEDRLLAGIN